MSLPTSNYTPGTVTVNVSAEDPDTLTMDGATVEISFPNGLSAASSTIVQAIAGAIATALTEAHPGWPVSQVASTTGTATVQLG